MWTLLSPLLLIRVGVADTPLRNWEVDVPRNVRPRIDAVSELTTTEKPPHIAMRIRDYKHFQRASSSPSPSRPPPTELPTESPPDVSPEVRAVLDHLAIISQQAEDWDVFLLDPAMIDVLRGNVRALARATRMVSHSEEDWEGGSAISRHSSYKTLRSKVRYAKNLLMNSIAGVWLEVGVLLVQALYLVDHRVLRKTDRAADGWAPDFARFGFKRKRVPPPIDMGSPHSKVDRVIDLAGLTPASLDPFNTSTWTNLTSALADVIPQLSESYGRSVARLIAALIYVFGQHSVEKINAALDQGDDPVYSSGPTPADWLEATDNSWLFVTLRDNGPKWREAAVARYFSTDGGDSVWESSDSSRTTIQPRRFDDSLPKEVKLRWTTRLRVCGRLLAAGFAFNSVPGLKFTPAVLALLQTPGLVDLQAVADTAGLAPEVRRDRIERIVVGIGREMAHVRNGLYDVLPVQALLDFLTPDQLERAVRGVDELTSEIVLNGTRFEPLESGSGINRWFIELVRMMNTDDLTRLIRFVTGSSQPPIDYAISPWLHVEVDLAADHDGPCQAPRPNHLVLPNYPSQAVLMTKMFAAIAESGV